MEIFIDCGLFELLAVVGLGTLARAIYSRRVLNVAFLVLTAAAPLVMLEMVSGPRLRWAGAVSAAMALVNVGVVAAAMQEGRIPRLRFQRRRERGGPSHLEREQPGMCNPRIPELTCNQEPVASVRSGISQASAR
jgi:hypothetical protein